MSKPHKSISEQLLNLKISVKKPPVVSSNPVEKPVTNEHLSPCKDLFSDYLYLHFKNESEAKIFSDHLWDTASVTSRVYKCQRCCKFHLVDPQGLKLVSKELKTYKYDSTTRKRTPLVRCSMCVSSQGLPKAIFSTLEHAQIDLENLGYEIAHPMYAYRCPHGFGIHLTKQQSRRHQYIGIVLQHKLAAEMRNKIDSVETQEKSIRNTQGEKIAETPVTIPKEPINVPSSNEEKKAEKFECLSCGWKNNYDTSLKCAWCGELGPYKNV